MTSRKQQAPAAVVALAEARQGVAAAEQALREAEREAREARQRILDSQDTIRRLAYDAARAGGRADTSEARKAQTLLEQDAAECEVIVGAYGDAVTDARRGLRQVILEHAPELLDLQAQHAAQAEQARDQMEQRHAVELAEQAAREQAVRLEATTVLDEMPNVFRNAMRGDELVPVIRPDRASPDLAPYEVDASMPPYLQQAISESRQLYRQETSPKMIAG
jgi:hypothetical protein